MTIFEASETYNIPVKILQEYERWGLCDEVKKVMGSWRYDDSDIERLSTIIRRSLQYGMHWAYKAGWRKTKPPYARWLSAWLPTVRTFLKGNSTGHSGLEAGAIETPSGNPLDLRKHVSWVDLPFSPASPPPFRMRLTPNCGNGWSI